MGARVSKRRISSLGLAIAAGLIALAMVAGSATAASGPELVQLSYSESDDGSSKPFDLSAYGYDIDALRFTTRYAGERASGEARYDDNTTDTDIHAHGEARHPWELVRQGEGRRVVKLIHRSLFERGVAKVRIRARGNGEHLDRAIEIRLSECTQDPPLYPVSCEVEV